MAGCLIILNGPPMATGILRMGYGLPAVSFGNQNS